MGPLTRALGVLFQPAAGSTGQNPPTATSDSQQTSPASTTTPSPGPGQQFASETLAALLGVQQQQSQHPTAATIADQLMSQADTDGDGQLSSSEIAAALGADGNNVSSDALTAAISKLDTDGDGKLSASELTSALQQQSPQLEAHHHHHHHGGGASSGDLALKIIGRGDADGDGGLSQSELSTELSHFGINMSDSDLATAFNKLDTSGDGVLSSTELAAAIQALRSGAATATTTSTTPGGSTADPAVSG
jgi:Ca2+-binding EF-hand superfamily protein